MYKYRRIYKYTGQSLPKVSPSFVDTCLEPSKSHLFAIIILKPGTPILLCTLIRLIKLYQMSDKEWMRVNESEWEWL